jgi:hypothetical protein
LREGLPGPLICGIYNFGAKDFFSESSHGKDGIRMSQFSACLDLHILLRRKSEDFVRPAEGK